MMNLDCNQIKIFYLLQDKKIKTKNYIYFKKKIYKNFCILVKSLGATPASKPYFYYIVYDVDSFWNSSLSNSSFNKKSSLANLSSNLVYNVKLPRNLN